MTRQFVPLHAAKEAYPENFYRIPISLFTCEHLQELSFEGLAAYGVLFDLAHKEGKSDSSGNLLVQFTQPDLADLLRCGREHARTIWRELNQHGAGLVEQVRIEGQYYIRVMDFRSYTTTI